MRVLVAEDDEALGAVLARGLREQGYVVDLVRDGETAVLYFRTYQYEVAVIDWRMPKLSGFDLSENVVGAALFPFVEHCGHKMNAVREVPVETTFGDA